MTCREYEPLIALYVEGDLDDRDVERHLAECSDCRELLEDLRSSQAALKELVSVDAALLTAVRSGVLAKMERRRSRPWPWVAAFAAVLSLVILTVPRRPPSIAKVPVSANSGAAAPVHAQAPVIAQAVPKSKRKRRRARESAPPLVVKMLTDDPNVVIIWLVDQPGD